MVRRGSRNKLFWFGLDVFKATLQRISENPDSVIENPHILVRKILFLYLIPYLLFFSFFDWLTLNLVVLINFLLFTGIFKSQQCSRQPRNCLCKHTH